MNWTPGGQPDHLTFAGLRGSKGGGTTTNNTTSGSSSAMIPDWLSNASQGAVQMAQNIASTPYTPYTGQMVAAQSPYTTQAFNTIEGMQGAANPAYNASQAAYGNLLGQVTPQTTDQINAMSNQLYGNYASNVVAPTAGLLGNYLQNAGPATAQQVGSNAMQLMSPYEQSVINPTLAIAKQQLAQQQQQTAAQANNVGAFGGTRMGVQQGVNQAQSTLGTESTISNLLASGYNQALGAGSTLANNASQQGYNAASLLAGQLGTGYQNAQQQAAGMANTNLSAGLTAAQQLPQVATAQQTETAKEAQALEAAGALDQNQQQANLNAQMSQFYSAQDYPYQSLDTLLSAVGAVPYSTTGTTSGTGTSTQTTQPGLMNEITGGLGAAASIAALI